METILTQFLLPILAVLTGIFLLVAFKALRIKAWQKEHEENAEERFSYTRSALTGVKAQVQDLSGKIDADVVPRFDDFYKKLVSTGVDLNCETLLQQVHEAGLEKADFITKDKSLILGGLCDDNINITYLFSLANENSDLQVYTFAFWFAELPPDFLRDLLKLNAQLLVGKVGLRSDPGGHILTVSHTLHLPNRKLQVEAIKNVIERISGVYGLILPIAEKYNAPRQEILAREFLELIAGEDKGKKLGAGAASPSRRES